MIKIKIKIIINYYCNRYWGSSERGSSERGSSK